MQLLAKSFVRLDQLLTQDRRHQFNCQTSDWSLLKGVYHLRPRWKLDACRHLQTSFVSISGWLNGLSINPHASFCCLAT